MENLYCRLNTGDCFKVEITEQDLDRETNTVYDIESIIDLGSYCEEKGYDEDLVEIVYCNYNY